MFEYLALGSFGKVSKINKFGCYIYSSEHRILQMWQFKCASVLEVLYLDKNILPFSSYSCYNEHAAPTQFNGSREIISCI